MNVAGYLEKVNCRFPFKINKELGSGADGQVFSLKKDLNKVIKLSIIFGESEAEVTDNFDSIKSNYNYLISNCFKNIAQVFEIGYVVSGKRVGGYSGNYLIYYSVMEKLSEPSPEELKVLNTVCHSFFCKEKLNVLDIKLKELNNYFSFDKKKIIEFYKFLRNCPIHHNDIHDKNIMKDDCGNFKLVDFDRIGLKNDGF